MDRTSVFNNAGVCFCQAGRLDVAQDMFLAALEETLLFARAPEDDAPEEQQQQQERVTTTPPPCVIAAETHLANMEAILSSSRPPTATTSGGTSQEEEEEVSSENTPPSQSTLHQANHQQDDRSHHENSSEHRNISSNTTPRSHHRAYLYTEPMSLQDSNAGRQDENNSTSPIQLIGAVVVFNLALVHHLRNKSSTKARQFYEISQALMEDGLQAMGGGGVDSVGGEGDDGNDSRSDAYRCTLLQVALTNNFGVWLYENGNVQQARESVQRLVAMSAAFGPLLPAAVQNGLSANIRQVQASLLVMSPSTMGKTLTPAW
jgi:hypothetical protein